MTADRPARIIARILRPRRFRLPAPRILLVAALIAAGGAFGIGFVVGTPSDGAPAARALETVDAPDTPAVPALHGDLAPLPDLRPAAAAPPATGSGSGSGSSSPPSTRSEPADDEVIIS